MLNESVCYVKWICVLCYSQMSWSSCVAMVQSQMSGDWNNTFLILILRTQRKSPPPSFPLHLLHFVDYSSYVRTNTQILYSKNSLYQTSVFRTSGFIEQQYMARVQSTQINVYGLFRTSDISSH